METYYYIFKTDNLTKKSSLVCCGHHNTVEECSSHWIYYMYGFMDAVLELSGVSITQGSSERSFRVNALDKDVEYFMLLGQEGNDLVYKLANQ